MDKSVKTNLQIQSFENGTKLWQKYKNSTDLQYRMSQTNVKLMTHTTHFQLQQTCIEPDSVQPSKSELLSRVTSSTIKFKSRNGRRAPTYLFAPEKYMILREREYHKNIEEYKRHLRETKQYEKFRVTQQHTKVVNAVGPAWYQEPSNKQKLNAEKIAESVQIDQREHSVKNTQKILLNFGLDPLPSKHVIRKAIEYCCGDPVQFLIGLFRLINPSVNNFRKVYTINDRIILSTMAHLLLPETLKEMHIRIPSPPPPVSPNKSSRKLSKLRQTKKNIKYASPYLAPLTFKSIERKTISFDTNLIYPNLPYFAYTNDLINLNALDKSEYKFKEKSNELDLLINKKSEKPKKSKLKTIQKSVPVTFPIARIYRYVIGGIATLRDGTTVPIINTIQYQPTLFPQPPTRTTHYVIAGIATLHDGTTVPIINTIQNVEVSPSQSQSKSSICQCLHLYNDYVHAKRLEHQKCLNIFRQYMITKQKQILKSQPQITYVISGVTETAEGPIYTLSGVQRAKTQLYRPIIGGVSMKNDEPTLIISGLQATQLYNEYLQTIKTPEIKPLEYAVEGIYDAKSNAVIVTDEGVTNPWLETKYTTIINGIRLDHKNGEPIHIVQGLAKTVQEPQFTYILGGVVKQPQTNEPLFIISGVKDGKPVSVADAFKPKCEYLIGGVKIMPDQTKVLIVQGLVLSRHEDVEQRAMDDGRKTHDCNCLLLYEKYMEMQTRKHSKCLELYEQYEKNVAFNEQLKKRPNITYIIGGINRTADGERRLIIAGVAGGKIVEETITTYIIGGVSKTPDGDTRLIITGVADTKNKNVPKKKHFIKENTTIIGGVKKLPDNTTAFIINGIATINQLVDDNGDDEKHEEEPPQSFMCRCLRIYNKWLDVELKEYDEEIIDGVGRRVDDIIVPFIKDIPSANIEKPIMPNTIKILPMPKKYYKISCNRRKQLALLKKVLTEMASDGYPLALLPESWLLPHFRVWMDKRCGRTLNENDKDKYFKKSRTMWNHAVNCSTKLERPKVPFTKEILKELKWDKIMTTRAKVMTIRRKTYDKMKELLVENYREFWPTTMPYDLPCSKFLDVFYSYAPSCKSDIFTFHPYK